MKLRSQIALLTALCTPALTPAIPFDTSASSTPATASVGLSGDYLTLSAASSAFSALAGINRPWVLEIQNDVTEASNCYFGTAFGANGSLTIRPAVGATPTATFTNTNNPAGFDGHLVLGAKNGAAINASTVAASSGRYIVDGCNTPGGTSRDLTIQAGTPSVSIASGSEILLNIVGNTDQAIVRNVKLGMHDTAGATAALGLSALQVAGTNLLPDGTTVRNCELVGGGTSNASGVIMNEVSGMSVSTGVAMENTLIEDCTIQARHHGIVMLAAGSATIQRNTVTVANGTNAATQYSGISHFDSNEIVGINTIIRRNMIDVTAPNGVTGIGLNPGLVTQGLYIIDNNIVRNLSVTGLGSPTAVIKRGIHTQTGTVNCMIEHNSINIGADPNVTISGADQVVGIALAGTFSSPHSASVRNNIVRMGQTGFGAAALSYAGHPNVTSNSNCLSSVEMTGWVSSSPYSTLANWQTGGSPPGFFGFDGAGQSANPFTTTPAWDGNLHFASKPVSGLATVASSNFTTDFDGDTRPFTGALPGADEPSPAASVGEWSWY